MQTAEHLRLATIKPPEDDLFEASPWYEWGPYLSERAWGTVREDYSPDGRAWDFFPHDHARSRAYRWNEDGLAGLSDLHHRLCLAMSFWNGRDPILKERIFGLTGPEGNHGEDAKEYWWYLDALPSHAWLRWRYHYPQVEFPYGDLVAENARRGQQAPEYELLDTGVFDDDRYWIIEVTYAKAGPRDIAARIEVRNAGPDEATLHVLPTLWFRNTWSWELEAPRPAITLVDGVLRAEDEDGAYRLAAGPAPDPASPAVPLFCENESNLPRLFGVAGPRPYPKDGINDHVIHGLGTVNPDQVGTKAAWWYRLTVPSGGTTELRLRLHAEGDTSLSSVLAGEAWAGQAFDELFAERAAEADDFYAALTPAGTTEDEALVLRQACAGMIWSKQFYSYDVAKWLDGDPGQPPPPPGHDGRNPHWRHLDAFDVMSMPDPWEYPWFAAWDLAFHTLVLAHLDPAFAKYQLVSLCREWFQHPNGALPAYEWAFDDVNPPVHAWAALLVFEIDGRRDHQFLARVFQKLLLNFTWWVNRQDPDGNNLFEGGFLGLDNISPLDRSHLPPGLRIEQSDGTAWMTFYCLAMLIIALVLAEEDAAYADLATKFLEHFVAVTRALNGQQLFDAEDGFFYDVVITKDGWRVPLKVRSMVGVIPLLSAATLGPSAAAARLAYRKRFARFLRRQDFDEGQLEAMGRARIGPDGRHLLLSVVAPDRLRQILREVFDEDSFLSAYGLRSLSKRHANAPFTLTVDGMEASVDYEPGESTSGMFGGNSNWRGPIWFPINYLTIAALERFHLFLGDDFQVELPTGSGRQVTLHEAADELRNRLVSIFLRGADGRRPVFAQIDKQQHDPAWRDNLQFHEYFHGETGAGLGASHQTGWTGLVAKLILDRATPVVPFIRPLASPSPSPWPSPSPSSPSS